MSREIKKINTSRLDFGYKKHLFNPKSRMKDAKKAKLEKLPKFGLEFKKRMKGGHVFDFGGAAGIDYFRMGKPKDVLWEVWELPKNVKFYKEMETDNLIFRTMPKVIKKSREKVLFSARGSLQYHSNPLEILKKVKEVVDVIYLNEAHFGEKSFMVEQVGVGPIWILSTEDIKKTLGKEFEVKTQLDKNPGWEKNEDNIKNLKCGSLIAIRK